MTHNLEQFRLDLYEALPYRRDTLFDLLDALSSNEVFAGFAVGNGDLTPVNRQGVFVPTQGDILDKTTGDDFDETAIEAVQGYLVNIIAGSRGSDPFIQDLMGIRLADKDEVEFVLQNHLT